MVNLVDFVISIHAPRVGSDPDDFQRSEVIYDFNPRSPCGELLEHLDLDLDRMLFQSTLPVWGATVYTVGGWYRLCISIHAPRVGSDLF